MANSQILAQRIGLRAAGRGCDSGILLRDREQIGYAAHRLAIRHVLVLDAAGMGHLIGQQAQYLSLGM